MKGRVESESESDRTSWSDQITWEGKEGEENLSRWKKGEMRLSSRRAIFDVLFRFPTVTRLHSPWSLRPRQELDIWGKLQWSRKRSEFLRSRLAPVSPGLDARWKVRGAEIGIVSTKIASAKGLLNWNATQLCQCTSVVFRLSSLQDLLCSLASCLIRSLYCISSSGNEGPILITSAPPPRHHGDDISSPPNPTSDNPGNKDKPALANYWLQNWSPTSGRTK